MQYKEGSTMSMSGQERREQILTILRSSTVPVSGMALAKHLDVSRQVIVQDIALLRANGEKIVSTNRGYIEEVQKRCSRVFKVIHTDEQVEEELNLYVDFGARVEDVFVYHKVHGVIRVGMNIRSRVDAKQYMHDISTGKSTQLMKLTSNYHYHTISADSEEILDMIQEELQKRGFLAKLQDYEPVDFWSKKTE